MVSDATCAKIPAAASSDAGVAGAGVLLSFIITAALAILLSFTILLLDLRYSTPSRLLRKLLLSLSDQQIITGLGIQAVGLVKLPTIIPYHFFLIWILSVLSTATHLSTLLVLVGDFKRDWVLRWIRQGMMSANLLLSCVYGVFVLRVVTENVPQTLPVACVWHLSQLDESSPSPRKGRGNAALSIAGTVAVMAGSCAVFALGVWYLHSTHRKWTRYIQFAGLILLSAFGIGATVRVLQVSQAFGTPDVRLSDEGERSWSFGQLLPLLLLLLPGLSAVEIVRGEVNVPAPVSSDDEGDGIPLVEGSKGRQGMYQDQFQPNPLWNSRR